MADGIQNHFLQLHMLTSYPPANLNRDDLGRPKTAVMGGVMRLRVSSQSLKRAWRTSEVFQSALGSNVGTRTKDFGVEVFQNLKDKGVEEDKAKEYAKSIAGVFGKLQKADSNKPLKEFRVEQLVHISPEEKKAVVDLIDNLSSNPHDPSKDELDLLRKEISGADIALFGRMLADQVSFNVEASAQVAHAIAVHKCQVEEDFFTAVDDLNIMDEGEDDSGAAHLGETEYGAGIFYLYVCIDRQLLLDNLSGDKGLMSKTLESLVECASTVSPGGKQASFASRAYASYILAEKGDKQPRSLSSAFIDPVEGSGMLEKAIQKLNESRDGFDKVYGACASDSISMNAVSGEGSLDAIKKFVSEE